MPIRDIAGWLAGLGLERYAAAFAENAVSAELLPTLTADDLRDLGVASVGHRRRLLNAIAALEPVPQGARREAERRQLTVLFVDLVGSTALARQLDPEDMSDLIRRFQNAVAGEIARLDGHLAKFMGDGVLAYFGWPQAHEDEAERAVRAALAIAGAVGRLATPSGSALAARAGIATGTVVVGEAIGEGSAREETVVGETPSLAARLQALAPPGGTLIAESTRQLLGRLFELQSAGGLDLKGFDGGVSAWRVLGEAAGQGRFEAQRGGDLTPMVGRDRELALLLERWAQARAGAGQAVLLLGEAGIGKSRLLLGLCDAVMAEPCGLIRWQGSPFHGGSPLWPVVQELAGDGGLDSVERSLRRSGVELRQALPLIGALLGLAAEEGLPAARIGGEAQRHRLLATLRDHLVGLAAQRPLLVILEDAHWVDPTTLELTRWLLERIGGAALLLVVASRPEGMPALPPSPRLTQLTLGRLGRSGIAAMVARLVPGEAQRNALLDAVIRRTDGVPLFVEELTKALAERSQEGGGDGEVPASLHDTLMARLDRLLDSKEVAQTAACIGREVAHKLLAAVSDRPEAELRRSLDRLCEAGLLFRRGEPPDAVYSFKHALVRDAAYESLLKSRRRAIHERILSALEAGVPPGAAASAETAAHHAATAELWAKALYYYGAAGKAAIDRAAYAEGIDLLAKALAAGGRHAGDTTAEVAMIDLRRARCWAFLAIGDTPHLLAELRDAESRAGRYGLARLSGQLRAQRAHVESIFGGHTRRAIGYGRDAARIAASLGDAELASAARFVLGQSYWIAGDYNAAVAELAIDAETYRSGLRVARIASSGTLAVDGLAILGGCLGLLGRWDEAEAHAAAARAIAAETGHPLDRICADWHQARTLLARGDVEAAIPLLEDNLELGRRLGMRMMIVWNETVLGQALGAEGRLDAALGLLDAALAGCAELRLQYTRTHATLVKAELCLADGRAEAAVLAAEGLELAQAHGYRALEACGLRLLAMTGDGAMAAARLAEAHGIALALGLTPELALIAAERSRLSPAR